MQEAVIRERLEANKTAPPWRRSSASNAQNATHQAEQKVRRLS